MVVVQVWIDERAIAADTDALTSGTTDAASSSAVAAGEESESVSLHSLVSLPAIHFDTSVWSSVLVHCSWFVRSLFRLFCFVKWIIKPTVSLTLKDRVSTADMCNKLADGEALNEKEKFTLPRSWSELERKDKQSSSHALDHRCQSPWFAKETVCCFTKKKTPTPNDHAKWTLGKQSMANGQTQCAMIWLENDTYYMQRTLVQINCWPSVKVQVDSACFASVVTNSHVLCKLVCKLCVVHSLAHISDNITH